MYTENKRKNADIIRSKSLLYVTTSLAIILGMIGIFSQASLGLYLNWGDHLAQYAVGGLGLTGGYLYLYWQFMRSLQHNNSVEAGTAYLLRAFLLCGTIFSMFNLTVHAAYTAYSGSMAVVSVLWVLSLVTLWITHNQTAAQACLYPEVNVQGAYDAVERLRDTYGDEFIDELIDEGLPLASTNHRSVR
ncbi:hypothetical protein G4Y79_00820 [Phototrophicus methaneseepsis]|uniref:Uncharacterized protein n=1 Tax=Phototrophicus methaneseepsis TaxID=2710758 RepID=A0A7S8IFH1_9CHLR|nr:hypothetical protein [Phototrophicus methaneseepsis]QPC82948.1 hypothetical protein G4Y79_00820 [Phototrophicus methaneseepsis]